MSDEREMKPVDRSLRGGEESCPGWEAAIVDLLDANLGAAEEAALRDHAANCLSCGELLREAGAGREWVRLLQEEPVRVPEELLGKILARTSTLTGSGAGAGLPGLGGLDVPATAGVLAAVLPHPGFHGQRQARLLMTAGMAFFSIALTLSLAGIRISSVHAAVRSPESLPASISASASRQFFDTKKQVVSFYDNLRLVREVEATVEDLRRSSSEGPKKGTETPSSLHPSAAKRNGLTGPEPLFATRTALLRSKADERNTL